MGVREDNYLEKKSPRVLLTAKTFLKEDGNISDIDLAEKINEMGFKTSSSTVGRDLSENLEECYKHMNNSDSLTEEQEKIVELIKQKRRENKLVGKVKGGINSTTNNDYIRDNNNKFQGSRKRV